MRGETVKVLRYTPTGENDPAGSPVTKVDIESVGNVLVSPGGMSNATDSLRPEGVTVAFTCLFPPQLRIPESARGDGAHRFP